jgi:hypothetical protein
MFTDTDAQLLAYAHIHQPYVRMFAGKAILNTGSVGLPFDGDPRSSYALVDTDADGAAAVSEAAERSAAESTVAGQAQSQSQLVPALDAADYQITIRRVRYDVEATVRAYVGSGHPFADSVIQAIRTGTRPS